MINKRSKTRKKILFFLLFENLEEELNLFTNSDSKEELNKFLINILII